eukprot:CAMPEP_0177667882 /NCGR_PEP_ID=MMETSP0447-20121125/22390_1 /TAXON_ID=0 /ORGANISM="Stygamoeba regulata, Strain BSH-02190019" /LENGTH=171 /DNA_ID=CAMNT_0019174203 /DNA_START=88 /DNA_END=599 /DNA_ORIENTATION=-
MGVPELDQAHTDAGVRVAYAQLQEPDHETHFAYGICGQHFHAVFDTQADTLTLTERRLCGCVIVQQTFKRADVHLLRSRSHWADPLTYLLLVFTIVFTSLFLLSDLATIPWQSVLILACVVASFLVPGLIWTTLKVRVIEIQKTDGIVIRVRTYVGFAREVAQFYDENWKA